jgi:hypothetical protein
MLSMHYTIGPISRRDSDFQQISEEAYLSLREARDRVVWLFSLHEDYDILLENYLELERALFDVTLQHVAMIDQFDRLELDARRRLLGRRLSNFLESISSLKGRLKRRSANTFGRTSTEVSLVDGLWRQHCSNSESLSLMMALRHFSQHSNFPIHGLSQLGRWEGLNDSRRERRVYCTEPSIDLDQLSQGRAEENEMLIRAKDRLGSWAPLFPEIRAAVSSLSSFLESVHRSFEPRLHEWLKELDDAVPQGDGYGQLCAAKWAASGDLEEEIHLSIDWRQRLKSLQRRHSRLVDLEKVEVSSLMPV